VLPIGHPGHLLLLPMRDRLLGELPCCSWLACSSLVRGCQGRKGRLLPHVKRFSDMESVVACCQALAWTHVQKLRVSMTENKRFASLCGLAVYVHCQQFEAMSWRSRVPLILLYLHVCRARPFLLLLPSLARLLPLLVHVPARLLPLQCFVERSLTLPVGPFMLPAHLCTHFCLPSCGVGLPQCWV
jgi:hypothetical protein